MAMSRFDYEFSGLFMGEGCIDICKQGRSDHHIRPRIRIGMHAKDRPMLEAIQSRYGGSLTTRRSDGSITWQLTGSDNLRRVCRILRGGRLSSAKMEEVRLLAEAIDLYAQPKRMREIQIALSRLKH